MLRDLDESGIICLIGAQVKPDRFWSAKVTPKGETTVDR